MAREDIGNELVNDLRKKPASATAGAAKTRALSYVDHPFASLSFPYTTSFSGNSAPVLCGDDFYYGYASNQSGSWREYTMSAKFNRDTLEFSNITHSFRSTNSWSWLGNASGATHACKAIRMVDGRVAGYFGYSANMRIINFGTYTITDNPSPKQSGTYSNTGTTFSSAYFSATSGESNALLDNGDMIFSSLDDLRYPQIQKLNVTAPATLIKATRASTQLSTTSLHKSFLIPTDFGYISAHGVEIASNAGQAKVVTYSKELDFISESPNLAISARTGFNIRPYTAIYHSGVLAFFFAENQILGYVCVFVDPLTGVVTSGSTSLTMPDWVRAQVSGTQYVNPEENPYLLPAYADMNGYPSTVHKMQDYVGRFSVGGQIDGQTYVNSQALIAPRIIKGSATGNAVYVPDVKEGLITETANLEFPIHDYGDVAFQVQPSQSKIRVFKRVDS